MSMNVKKDNLLSVIISLSVDVFLFLFYFYSRDCKVYNTSDKLLVLGSCGVAIQDDCP